ncbi:iron-containing alcohol dehydrogenase family protein [Paenisporosarcina macmurdoensis]|uniref:Iron-containing alcohol dehydrogenase family protein n=1 Tax=Paenisporosarcina macmurdoensis TaxID=212659 RepID=A0ABW1L495_9BACL
MEDIIIRGAPAEYVCKSGVLEELEDKLTSRNIKRVLIVSGVKSWYAARYYFPTLKSIHVTHAFYKGQCTVTEISRVAALAQSYAVDAIIGVGGGKVLDVVKAAASASRTKSVLIPTLASNCAPWTPLSVIYSDEGVMSHYDVYPISVDLLLVEPRILVEAPAPLLIAGIGDTLAKWYEADVQIRRLTNPPVALKVAHHTARLCAEEMFEHAEEAVNDAKDVRVSNAFVRVVESIIMLGGMVGGFGDRYGRIAGAHSIHNGMTIAPESHEALHGNKVAYGILVQLLLEQKESEVERLLPFYQKLGLPTSLYELNIPSKWIDEIAQQATRMEESIHHMRNEKITASEVAQAMHDLESRLIIKL